jgi:hypothetical protein
VKTQKTFTIYQKPSGTDAGWLQTVDPTANMSWRDRAYLALYNRPAWLTLASVATATGLPLGWLKLFSRGKIAEPSVNRIETLLRYFETQQ